MSTVTIHVGSNLDVIPSLAENSVDAIVTDPPYELGFMGKSWDASGIAYNVDLWKQCLRVLKPGGHLLAFSGSRTYHRMTCAIEDAGFEVRDQIMWVYGSGFPKSLNVGKALDKTDGTRTQRERRLAFTAWVRSQGVTAKQINEATGTMMGSHYTTELSQPAVMTVEHLEACRHLFKQVPAWVEDEARKRSVESENFKRREVVGKYKGDAGGLAGERLGTFGGDITAHASEAAKRWDGWGTALKPAHEPICVARKPLEGTVADNVMKWGTGAINVDGCRIGEATPGRWPANLIHDGSEEVLELFPSNAGAAAPVKSGHSGKSKGIYGDYAQRGDDGATFRGDSGSAARFFYCPKASKKDRDDGCEGMPKKEGLVVPNATAGTWANVKFARNHHPTVKPTDLMRYLCRLVTPPGGTVLDPFMGSGSTGRGAVLEGFNFIGVELSDEYAAIAKARIDAALSK